MSTGPTRSQNRSTIISYGYAIKAHYMRKLVDPECWLIDSSPQQNTHNLLFTISIRHCTFCALCATVDGLFASTLHTRESVCISHSTLCVRARAYNKWVLVTRSSAHVFMIDCAQRTHTVRNKIALNQIACHMRVYTKHTLLRQTSLSVNVCVIIWIIHARHATEHTQIRR